MEKKITSRELLADVGASVEDKPEIPPCYRHLLITSVITFVSARKLQTALNNRGHAVSFRDVLGWQNATREWLGLPEVGRGKPSDDYRNVVKMWLQDHGNPTLDDIDAGWVPTDKRENNSVKSSQLSPKHRHMMEEFRMEMAGLNAAKDDEETRLLLAKYLKHENIMELLDEKNWSRHDVLPRCNEEQIVENV